MSEFQRDLNEFVLWLEETDNITSIPLEPENEQQLKEKLEEVKVILFPKISQGLLVLRVYESRGSSHEAQLLGLCAFTTVAWVQALVRELRCHKPHGGAKNKRRVYESIFLNVFNH